VPGAPFGVSGVRLDEVEDVIESEPDRAMAELHAGQVCHSANAARVNPQHCAYLVAVE